MAKNRVYLSSKAFTEMYNGLVESETFFIDGTNSLYVPAANTSFIDETVCKEWPDQETGEVILMTPGEAARQTIGLYLGYPNLRAAKRDFKYLDIPPPLYYNGVKRDNVPLWYIDLEGAYYQIYKYMSLDIAVPRGQGELLLYDVANRLARWKTARNSVVGITRQYEICNVKGKRVWFKRYRNPYFNPHLWWSVQCTLHELATVALQCDAQYIGVDCYIFRRERDYLRFGAFLEEFDFAYRSLADYGYIYGYHSYKVGPKFTKHERRRSKFASNVENERGMVEWRLKQKKLID